jgi:hypothetical protein
MYTQSQQAAILITMSDSKQTFQEEIKVSGEQLIGKVKELIKEGNVRRIIIKDKEQKTLVEIPVTVGVIGAVFAPVLAAVGAIAALVAECTIIVERKKDI